MRLSWLLPLLLTTALLAGCSDGGDGPTPTDDAPDDLGLTATEETGIIRGVVVDESIQPIAGVTITLKGTERSTQSNLNGAFGFDGLEPGSYFLEAVKVGFFPAQQNVEVEAGVADPPTVKILLTADVANQPSVEEMKFEGFIECSFSLVAVGFAACDAPNDPLAPIIYTGNFTNDQFMVEYDLARIPDWTQSEMIWESTQQVSDAMSLSYSAPGSDALLVNYASAGGPSPVLVKANRTLNEQYSIGGGNTLLLRVFNEPVEGTRPSDPVNGDDCLDRPVLGGCATGAGATIEQKFQIFTHVFYGFTPGPDWRFSEDGEPSLP